MDIIRVFGSNVRYYREQKGISQEKLAEMSGLHRTYISDIESFQRSISLSNVQKLADALEVEAYLLFVENKCFFLCFFSVMGSHYPADRGDGGGKGGIPQKCGSENDRAAAAPVGNAGKGAGDVLRTNEEKTH